jgi:sigma-B regulation protein RsbU (phosphoserine phosphatase)
MSDSSSKKKSSSSRTPTEHVQSLRDSASRAVHFGRRFTAGINRREVGRLFDEEARGAFSVLAGETPEGCAEDDDFTRLLVGFKNVILGLVLKLSPARRLLFVVALLCPCLGFFDLDVSIGPRHFFIDFSAFWFLVSIALLTLLLSLELVDRLRVRDEVEVARALQRDLLPQSTPPIPGFRVAHSYRTANDIGGDYYDFLPLDDGRWGIAVGDASGHGIGAGLLMAIANASLKTAIDLDPSPQAVLELLNRVLYRTGNHRAFMTLFYAVLDPRNGEFEYACGGHPFPLLRRTSGEIIELGTGAFPLGLRPAVKYHSERLVIEPGDFLLLYSDGLPEALGGGKKESFGFPRLQELLAQPQGAQSLHDAILTAFDRHLAGDPLNDDLTLVVMDRAPRLPGEQ